MSDRQEALLGVFLDTSHRVLKAVVEQKQLSTFDRVQALQALEVLALYRRHEKRHLRVAQ